jgi:hypothetical protein
MVEFTAADMLAEVEGALASDHLGMEALLKL